jgi:NAD(P)-dependent dehydrogenase (short-subunit alcohol dehydrogenase family)
MALPDFSLKGEIVALTGGAGILGQRFVAALAAHGAKVAVLDRDSARAQQACAANRDQLRPYVADVSDATALRSAARRIEAELGAVTALVNAAATKSEHFFEPFETFPLEDWDSVMAVNCTAAMLACQVFGVPMAERGKGSIVNILSIYGIRAPDQRIYEGSKFNTPAVYSASKAALWGLTRYLATYWGERGVRVNAITPGGVFHGHQDPFLTRYSARVPMGRMAQEDEMSGALVYLLSGASSYVTGQNMVVDGGLSVW